MNESTPELARVHRRHGHRAANCPDSRALAALAAGRNWPWQRRRLVDHLAHCPDCADDYRVLTAARGGLINALHEHAGRAPALRLPGMRPLAATASAVALAVLVGIMALRDHDPVTAPGQADSSGASNPGRPIERDVVFVSRFESRSAGPADRSGAAGDEVLFSSGFDAAGEPNGAGGPATLDG